MSEAGWKLSLLYGTIEASTEKLLRKFMPLYVPNDFPPFLSDMVCDMSVLCNLCESLTISPAQISDKPSK